MNEGARILQNPNFTSIGSEAVNSVPNTAASNIAACPTCGANNPSPQTAIRGWVYAIGRILPQFPDLGVEKEFAQLAGGAIGGMLKTNELIEVLKNPDNAYLARQLCWVFLAGDVEVFTLMCQDDTQARRLVEALPSDENAEKTVQVVVGPLVNPGSGSPCAKVGIPAVVIDHQLSFTIDDFIDALATEDREGKEEKGQKPNAKYRIAIRDLFARLTRRSDNRGMTDEHRALNYVALRYPSLY